MLSGRMKPRVAIVRGMAMAPDVLMDEPFAAHAAHIPGGRGARPGGRLNELQSRLP